MDDLRHAEMITFSAGTHIASAAQQLIEAARSAGDRVRGKFNDVVLTADPCTNADMVVASYTRECEARSEAYRNSPAGKAAALKQNQERAELQAKHDALMRQLPALDFSNDVAVLDWMCAMQEPSDRRGVIVRRETIVSAFERHGFKANENCGDAFKPDDRDNAFRYLIGQCLAGLKEGPAIHGIIHKFADDWRRRFVKRGEIDA